MNDSDAVMDLFDPRHLARASDHHTSHAAAESMEGKLSHQHEAVMQCLKSYGPMTAEQIGDLLRYPVWRRMNELERRGRIEKTGTTAKNRSGREAAMYRLA